VEKILLGAHRMEIHIAGDQLDDIQIYGHTRQYVRAS
jgi:hypothetical protein